MTTSNLNTALQQDDTSDALDPHRRSYPLPKTAFLYERMGPWPQPAPDHPMEMAAEVLHPSKAEKRDWAKHAGRAYLRTMLTSIPRAAVVAFTHGHVKDMSDEVFTEMLTTTIYSKYLRPAARRTLDPLFTERLTAIPDSLELYTTDFTPVQDIQPYAGMYVSPTITLLGRESSREPFRALAIRIGHLDGDCWQHIVLMPEDGDAWTLAKYFVMQGAGHVTTLSGHPATHFPFDTVNAVTTSALPMRHTLFQLLRPHLRLALAVNHAVLEGGSSVVSETRGEIYAPYVAPGAEVRQLVAAGYVGYPHELSRYEKSSDPGPSFPRWTYPLRPPVLDAPSDFGHVLKAYHATIKDFVRDVVTVIVSRKGTPRGDEELYYIRCWAMYISQWLRGFPDHNRILEPDENGDPHLVSAVTSYIWDVSVAHSLDHRSFYRLTPRRTPFRVRMPPPRSRTISPLNRRQILNGWDLFKATLAFDMFFQPHNIELLKDVRYGFDDEGLRKREADFRVALAATEEQLRLDGVDIDRYIPLGEIATSIQY